MEYSKEIEISYWKSPVGELLLGTFNGELCICDWRYRKMRAAVDQRVQSHLNASYVEKNNETMDNVISQLSAYFSGKRKEFDIPLLFCGSSFQQSVWKALLTIPYGTTASYLELSRRLGNEKAIRAVAAANGANSISIMVPCHRIIGSNGELTGYAGGIPAKKKLLELEGALIQHQLDLF